jgi:hypothetical protein
MLSGFKSEYLSGLRRNPQSDVFTYCIHLWPGKKKGGSGAARLRGNQAA